MRRSLLIVCVCVMSAQVAYGYFELMLKREPSPLKINVSQTINPKEIPKCAADYSDVSLQSRTYAFQLCYKKDLSYNAQVLVGDVK